MIIALTLAIVDLPARNQQVSRTRNPLVQNQTDWSCGLTARKEGTYQRSSKQKHRRSVPADWVYYLQSECPLQRNRSRVYGGENFADD